MRPQVDSINTELFADLILVAILPASTAGYALINFDTTHAEPATMLQLKAALQPFVPDRFIWWNVSSLEADQPRLYLRIPQDVADLIKRKFDVPYQPYKGQPCYFKKSQT